MATKITLEDVRAGEYKLVDRFFDLTHVGYYTNSEGHGIPQLCIAWVPTHYIYITKAEWLELPHEEQVFFDAPGKYDHDPKYSATAMPIRRNGEFRHQAVTLMNFRRYSWSYASGWKADQGYGGGIVYANNIDGSITCDSEEQVIRETLVGTIHEMVGRYGFHFARIIRGTKLKPLLDRMVKDAIEHANEHAARAVGATNGAVMDATVTIAIDGEVEFARQDEWSEMGRKPQTSEKAKALSFAASVEALLEDAA